MLSSRLNRLVLGTILAVLAFPIMARAQGATVTGTVADTSGGVLPGVVVTARNEATGNVFEGVTDGTGMYRLEVRPGVYELTAQLPGFQTIVQTDREVLVGQTITVSFELGLSTLEETITVTGEQPLLDVTSSSVSDPPLAYTPYTLSWTYAPVRSTVVEAPD